MQTLWSRLASSTKLSCRCPSCVSHSSSLAGVARRPITAAGKKPKYAYSSTFVYSGIFAAAATTDAAVKQRRRERWDKAIGEMRQEIGDEEELGEQVLLNTASVELKGEQFVVGGHELKTKDAAVLKQEQEQERAEPEALFEENSVLYRPEAPIWPANTGLPLIRHNLPPQSGYAYQHNREKALRRTWTPKKLRTTELSVDRLVLRLILYLDEIGQLQDALSAAPESMLSLLRTPREQLEQYLKSTEDRLADIRYADAWLTAHHTKGDSFDFTTPVHAHSTHYDQSADRDTHITTSDSLHNSLKSIFHAHQLAHSEKTYLLPTTLIKICHNLSISPAPPLLNVWNTLIQNLTSAHFNTQKPAEYVIDSIRGAHVRLNEDTMIAVLTHCVKADKSQAFAKWVGLMRGEYHGLSLARPDINITESGGASRLVRVDEEKVIQNPYPTPRVFEALIQGVLHFAGFEAALRICRDMGFSGWGLSIRGLLPLLKDCVSRGDWESGEGVWKQMQLLKMKSRRDGRGERVPLSAFVEVLKLKAGQGAEYEVMWGYVGEATREGWLKKELLERFEEERGTLGQAVFRRVMLGEGASSGKVWAPKDEAKKPSRKARRELRKKAKEMEQISGGAASEVLSDLTTRESGQENATLQVDASEKASSHASHFDIDDSTETWRPFTSNLSVSPEDTILEREHLVGDMAATYDLDDYEARERPMRLYERA